MKNLKKKILHNLGNSLAPIFVDLLVRTYKIEVENEEFLLEQKKNGKKFIAAFWHGKMLVTWFYLSKFKISALVSQSKDGEILTRVLNKWNYKMIRGSSHVGGKEALQLMQETVEDGFSLAITPDGPTGPKYEMKAGSVVLAKKTQTPLVLVSVCSKKHWRLKSWDKFEIPKPFSKVKLSFSEPIYIDKDLSYEETDFLIKNINEQMNLEQNRMSESC